MYLLKTNHHFICVMPSRREVLCLPTSSHCILLPCSHALCVKTKHHLFPSVHDSVLLHWKNARQSGTLQYKPVIIQIRDKGRILCIDKISNILNQYRQNLAQFLLFNNVSTQIISMQTLKIQ